VDKENKILECYWCRYWRQLVPPYPHTNPNWKKGECGLKNEKGYLPEEWCKEQIRIGKNWRNEK